MKPTRKQFSLTDVSLNKGSAYQLGSGADSERRAAPTAQPIIDKLHIANAYNRRLIEARLDPLVTIGPDGKIIDLNTATEKATGCPREELVGTDFSDYFTQPEKARDG